MLNTVLASEDWTSHVAPCARATSAMPSDTAADTTADAMSSGDAGDGPYDGPKLVR